MRSKFDEVDRRAVVDEIRRYSGQALSKVGSRRKWYRDSSDRNYWIIGGYGQWHGIPEEMMDAEVASSSDGVLAIAIRKKAEMEIFVGSLGPLVASRDRLYRATKTTADYQFTFTRRGHHLIIDQVPEATLEDIGRFPFGEVEKRSTERLRQIERRIKGLSVEEREELLKKLEGGS